MNRVLAGCVVVVLVGCSGNGGTGGSGGGSSSGGGTGGGSAGGGTGGGSAGGGTGGGSAGGGTGGGTVDAGIPMGPALLSLAAGEVFTCAVLADKTAKCWGRNNSGQLGSGVAGDSTKPVAVMGLTTVKQISAGYEHACAVLDDGTARCWGYNGNGQLGNNTKTASNVPVTVMGLSGVASIHAGVYTSCALTTAGQVYCWGRGGDVGDGTVVESLVPKLIPGLADVKQLSVAPNSGTATPIHVCGVRTGGGAFCWGNNADGQLGDNSQFSARAPVAVVGPNDAGIMDAIEITASGSHACARRTSGLYCWGFSQEVGDGTIERRFKATAVDTTAAVDQLEAGNDQTLARTTDGGMICWGRNTRGQCGDGAAFTSGGPIYLSPKPTGLGNVTIIAAGGFHACAYQASTTVTWCWGATDYGALGYQVQSGVTRTSTPDFVRW